MKFKYSEYEGLNKTRIFRPTVPVILKNGLKIIPILAVVDSGADYTILPIEIAGALDLKLSIRDKTTFHGAGNNLFNVYPSPLKIEFILRQEGFRTIKWQTGVYFAESQPAILLGHKGFLEKFKVILDGKKKEIEIQD